MSSAGEQMARIRQLREEVADGAADETPLTEVGRTISRRNLEKIEGIATAAQELINIENTLKAEAESDDGGDAEGEGESELNEAGAGGNEEDSWENIER